MNVDQHAKVQTPFLTIIRLDQNPTTKIEKKKEKFEKMRPTFCQSCLASILKFLNFLQGFVGVSIVIYSIWVLDHWFKHDLVGKSQPHLAVAVAVPDLPDPWFVYCMMGLGGLMCLFAFAGYVAAETVKGCCLCFYALLSTLIIVLESVLLGFVLLDKRWEEDIPNDPTGEIDELRSFFATNLLICKWSGLTVIVIQALSLILAIVLRSMVSTSDDFDSDDEDVPIRRPLLNPQYVPSQV